MAEDANNPLNNPGAEPVTQTPTPRAEPPEDNAELADFLDDIFDSTSHNQSEDPPEPASSPPEQSEPSPSRPEPDGTSLPSRETGIPTEARTAQPAPAGDTPEPQQDDLQRQVLQRLNEQLERMGQPQAPEEPPAEPITPEVLQQQYQPRIQQYVEAGWLDEDFVSLYPKQAALMVHMWDMGTQMQQGVQQTQQFTQEEQQRRAREDANRQLNTALDEVAARGDVFSSLGSEEVRTGFRDFLVQELDLHLSQVNADFLARQFYAYNHELILDTVRQGQAEAPPAQGEPTAAQLAQQEGASTRTEAAAPTPPDFMDLLEGTAAARWYQ